MGQAVAEPLGQQELEPPAPARVVRAPAGAVHWGCDPSTRRLSIAWVGENGGGVLTRSFPTGREGERLTAIYEQTWEFAAEVVEAGGRPGFVWIEQPFGKNVPPVSHMAVGAMMAAMHGLLRVPVELVGAPVWKVGALGQGFGTCSKKDPAGYPVMRWARANGYRGSLEDEADAFAIAVAASRAVGFSR